MKQNSTLTELNRAKALIEELRNKLADEIIDTLTEEKFAYEIAEETGIPSCTIASMLCNAYPYCYRVKRTLGTVKKTYVCLNADGTTNPEDTITVSYEAVRYSKI